MSTNQEAEAFYQDVEFLRNKIIQTITIKQKLDAKREFYVNEWRTHPNKDTFDNLLNVYKRMSRLFRIIEKGIKNTNKFSAELEIILKEMGVTKHLWTKLRRKNTDLTIQSIFLLRLVAKKTKKYLKHMNKESKKIKEAFDTQYLILQEIKKTGYRQILIREFIDEYDKENKSIKEFHKQKFLGLLINTVRRISPKQAAILFSLTRIPGPTHILPTAVFFIGAQYTLILAVFMWIIKYGSITAYSTYLYKRPV